MRRAEALYALIADRHGSEHGVAGILWAQRRLHEGNGEAIEFAQDAEPGSATYYLKQAWGIYGLAYASQLFEVGVLAQAPGHMIPVPSKEIGEPLAAAFEMALGPLADRFFETIGRGNTGAAELDEFRIMTPSEIRNGSEERDAYEELLFAASGLERGSDLERRKTLLLVLALTRQFGRAPNVWDIRWALYAGHDDGNKALGFTDTALEAQRWRWWVYQANDLTHLCYGTLLKFTLDMLESYPAGIALAELIAQGVAAITNAAEEQPASWGALVERIALADHALERSHPHAEFILAEEITRGARHDGTCAPETAWLALKLLAVVHKRARMSERLIRQEFSGLDPTAFRSLLTEMRFLDAQKDKEFPRFLSGLIEERIIRRHLWVALRKFRYQGDYTFLIETDDGKVRLRTKAGPVYTNPRLGPAITFLRDIHLIDDDGLTALGEKRLAAA